MEAYSFLSYLEDARNNLNESNVLDEHRDKWHTDDEHIEHVERGPQESALVEDQPVGDQLEEQLDGEDAGEAVVEVTQQLKEEAE